MYGDSVVQEQFFPPLISTPPTAALTLVVISDDRESAGAVSGLFPTYNVRKNKQRYIIVLNSFLS